MQLAVFAMPKKQHFEKISRVDYAIRHPALCA
jgi:hypothetical protein